MSYVKPCYKTTEHNPHEWSDQELAPNPGPRIFHRCLGISTEQTMPKVVREPAAVQPVTSDDYTNKKQYDEILHQRNVLIDALIKTVEYIGLKSLPPIAGWPWYDAIFKYAPLTADRLYKEFVALGKIEDSMPNVVKEPAAVQPVNAVTDPHADGSARSAMHQIDLAEIFISRRLSDISANPALVDSVSAQGLQALLIVGDLLAAGWRPSDG